LELSCEVLREELITILESEWRDVFGAPDTSRDWWREYKHEESRKKEKEIDKQKTEELQHELDKQLDGFFPFIVFLLIVGGAIGIIGGCLIGAILAIFSENSEFFKWALNGAIIGGVSLASIFVISISIKVFGDKYKIEEELKKLNE